jgi:exonuclease SbcD
VRDFVADLRGTPATPAELALLERALDACCDDDVDTVVDSVVDSVGARR